MSRGKPWDDERSLDVWRGYLAHSLLFYRQNKLSDLDELAEIGRDFKAGPLPTWPGEAASALLHSGLRRAERYWGSLRLAEEAFAEFESAARLAPKSPWPLVLMGMVHEMRRRYTAANGLFDRAIELEPRWAWPRMLRGICRWYLADFSGSARDFSAAARVAPTSEWPLLFLARSKADLRDRTLVRDLNRAVRLSPRSGFARSWRGRALFVLRRAPEALKDLEASIRLLPDYDRGWSWLGVSLIELGRFGPALELLRRANQLNPYYPTTLYPMAHACLRLGRFAEAGRALRAGAFIDRSGVWIEHRISMGHPNPACLRSLADLDEYIRKRPREAWAWAWRGQTQLLLKNYWNAISDLDRASSIDSNDPWTFVWRGEAWRRLGFHRRALVDLDRSLALDRRLAWALAAKGKCLLEIGKTRRALTALDRSLKLSGQCAEALSWRGEARLRLGAHREAVDDLESALRLKPRHVRVPRLLWEALARQGAWPEAEAALNGLVAKGGSYSDGVWASLAWTKARSGRLGEAKETALHSLRLNPAQPLALRIAAGAAPTSFEDADALSRSAAQGGGLDAVRFEAYCRARESKACLNALLNGRIDDALLAADSDRPSNDAERLLFRGWLRLEKGDARGAIEEASRALDETLDPDHDSARRLRETARRKLEKKL